ncbi:MAG TPA: DUF1501 domain-containing protein [Candidatus Dormibacteraeota bacterium]|jgi:uncharacterized protein (DUF1501 family)|nr:DUF1501 domain-containing protein [Candidatus Dormibacteraeota bacterium]
MAEYDDRCQACRAEAEAAAGKVGRRAFIRGSLAVVSVGLAMPSIFSRAVEAAAGSAIAGPAFQDSGKVLIVVQLAGGNDGLNTVIPFADPNLAKLRQTLTQREDQVAFKLDDHLGLHSALAPLRGLWDGGRLAVVGNVGYPNPSLSHFQSMDVWETMDLEGRDGWLGKYLSGLIDKDGHPLTGVDIDNRMSPALRALAAPVSTFTDPSTFTLESHGASQAETALRVAALDKVYRAYPEAAPYAALLQQTEANTVAASRLLHDATAAYTPQAQYPAGPFGNGLKVLAEAIVQDLGMRVGYITLGGFDTHRAQADQHSRLLALLAGGISALMADLTAHGRSQDVALMTWSEFGRRAQENASGGTDHGTAAPLFIAGDGVRGGVYGEPPNLGRLDQNGNLAFQTDFRAVYATMLEGWLKVPADAVIPARYQPLPLLTA